MDGAHDRDVFEWVARERNQISLFAALDAAGLVIDPNGTRRDAGGPLEAGIQAKAVAVIDRGGQEDHDIARSV